MIELRDNVEESGGCVFGFVQRMRDARSRRASRPKRKLPQKPLAPVEEIVEQGLLVADVAVRMSVKNTIIMNALRRDVDYEKAHVEKLVRNKTIELAEERIRDAKHIKRMRDEIKQFGRSAWSESEYGSDDNRTLRHRQEVYEQLSAELNKQAADNTGITATAEQALAAAWSEIGDSLKDRASHPYYAGGSSREYQEKRDARIQKFIEHDLTELTKQHGSEASRSRLFKRKNTQ